MLKKIYFQHITLLVLIIGVCWLNLETVLCKTPKTSRTVRTTPTIARARFINKTRTSTTTTTTTNTTTTTTTTTTTMIASDRPKNGSRSKKIWRYESRLLRYLFDSDDLYNTDIRPAKFLLEPVVVTIEFVLRQITDIVEKSQQIAVSGFLKITWIDERLMWNPEHFGGVEWIVVSTDSIWLPDIALVNSEQLYCISRDGRFPVTLTSGGEVFYVPAGKIYARCNFDLRYFPFDYQLCRYRFESWVYTAEYVTLVGTNFTIDSDHYVDNHQWEIYLKFVKTSIVKYEEYNFSRVEFYLLLRRRSIYFITYTIFPCIALSALQIISHMLPFTDKQRINFATAILIAFSVFHVAIVDQMPKTSHGIPLLAIYIDGLMCLIGLSLMECFFMINWLAKVECSVPSPVWWTNVVERWGGLVFLGSNGLYWRRHYLRIYYEVCAKNKAANAAKRKRRESRLRQQRDRFARKFNSLLKQDSDLRAIVDGELPGMPKVSSSDVPAVLKIAKTWGWQSRRTSVPMDVSLIRIQQEAEDVDNVVEDMNDLDTIAGLCIGNLQSNLPFKVDDDDNDDDAVSVSDSDSNSSVCDQDDLKHCSDSSNKSSSLSGGSFDARLSTIELVYKLSRTVSNKSTMVGKSSKARRALAAEWKITERELASALVFLKEMGTLVRSGLHTHNLRRECIQVWATFITVADRMISAFLLVLCAFTPIALFVIFPAVVPIPQLPDH